MPDLLCQNQSYSSSLPCFCIYGLSTSVFLGIMFCLPWLTLSVLYFHVFKQRYDVSACDCTQGPYKHCNSVRLKVESERKILCCSGKSTLYQRCTGHITQLGFTPPPPKKKRRSYITRSLVSVLMFMCVYEFHSQVNLFQHSCALLAGCPIWFTTAMQYILDLLTKSNHFDPQNIHFLKKVNKNSNAHMHCK